MRVQYGSISQKFFWIRPTTQKPTVTLTKKSKLAYHAGECRAREQRVVVKDPE
jgi:hypothetical protein